MTLFPRLLVVTFLLTSFCLPAGAQTSKSLGFVGSSLTSDGLTDDEKAAFEFAKNEYGASYYSLNALANNESNFDKVNALWWHSNSSNPLPADASNAGLISSINEFIENGNGLFLSGFATQWVVTIGLEDTKPQEVAKGNTTSGNWGFLPKRESPIFKNLSEPFITLSSGNTTENVISWWNIPNSFDGIWLADTEWDSGSLVTAGEYTGQDGKVIVVGAGAFDWHLSSGTNTKRSNLEIFTRNIINYITPSEKAGLGFVISEAEASIDEEVEAALDWSREHFDVQIIDLSQDTSLSALADQKVIWWHAVTADTTFPGVSTLAMDSLRSFVNRGNGLLLSGTATPVALRLNLEENRPDISIEVTDSSSTSGYYVSDSSHPVFTDINSMYLTLSSDLKADQRAFTWSDDTFSGDKLADTEFRTGEAGIGEYKSNGRKVLVTGSKAFDWHHSGENSYRENLSNLTLNMLNYLSQPVTSTDLISHISFEDVSENEVTDSVNNRSFFLFSNFDSQFQTGPVDQALRFDGYTTWLSGNIEGNLLSNKSLSIETWAAIESYSVRESAFVSNVSGDEGFIFGMTNIGHPFLKVREQNGWTTYQAAVHLKKREWIHLSAVYNGDSHVAIYQNGEEIFRQEISGKTINHAFDGDLLIGRNQQTGVMRGLFPMGIFNGYLDEVKMYNIPLSESEIVSRVQSVTIDSSPEFKTPDDRYTNDIHRPRLHPMPSSDWTNETHGLIWFEGEYHLFFQKNPTGPFFDRLHWGHLVSTDMINWREVDYAFGPKLSYDKVGTWSGAVVTENDKLYAFYTGVDGAKATIASATTTDGRNFEKSSNNPLIPGAPSNVNHLDFRDPYLWQEDGKWYMIVGAGIQNEGGALFLYSSSDLVSWEYLKVIQPDTEEPIGPFWEMPVMMKFGEKRVLLINPVPQPDKPANLLYWVGEWKNENFVPDHREPKQLELINHLLSPSVMKLENGNYAAIAIVPDQRPESESYNSGWVHAYSFPREYWLEDGELYQKPLEDLEKFRKQTASVGDKTLSAGENYFVEELNGKKLEISFDLIAAQGSEAGIELFRSQDGTQKTTLLFERDSGELSINLNNSSSISGVQTGLFPSVKTFDQDTLSLRIFLDHSFVEVFVDGKYGFAKRVYPDADSKFLNLFTKSGTSTFENVIIHELDSDVSTSLFEESQEEYNFELLPNYPNPFNPSTNIGFRLNEPVDVTLEIYDALGRKVDTLINGRQFQSGYHNITWSAENANSTLSSGVYFIRLEAGDRIQTRKMALIK